MLLRLFKYEIEKQADLYKQLCRDNCAHPCDILYTVMVSLQTNRCKNLLIYVETNPFLQPFVKKLMIDIYCVSMNRRRTLSRFFIAHKRKRMIACNTDDLSCGPLSEHKASDLIHVFDRNVKYTFKQSDLYNIILSSLTNADEYMIATPMPIKNPYTSLPFSKSLLYILFLQMKSVHPLFSYFMKCNFDETEFLLQYEGLLRTHTIEKTLVNFTPKRTSEILKSMIPKITIYNLVTGLNEPIVALKDLKGDLIALKPLLSYYYNYLFSMNPYQRHVDHKKLVAALIKLRNKDASILMYTY